MVTHSGGNTSPQGSFQLLPPKSMTTQSSLPPALCSFASFLEWAEAVRMDNFPNLAALRNHLRGFSSP